MKKIDLGQLISILANVGVIAGIAFLAIELRQNNELMEAEARFNRLSISRDGWDQIAENGELTELRVRSRNGETLTEVERERVDALFMRVLVNIDWMYRELPADSPERQYVGQVLLRNFADDDFRTVWNARKEFFDAAFVEWVDETFVD